MDSAPAPQYRSGFRKLLFRGGRELTLEGGPVIHIFEDLLGNLMWSSIQLLCLVRVPFTTPVQITPRPSASSSWKITQSHVALMARVTLLLMLFIKL